MFNIFWRLRNLWRLSAYRINENFPTEMTLRAKKEFPTIKKKLATIIPPEREDLFKPQEESSW